MKRSRTAERFAERFGHKPEVCAFAPGRIEFIGNHTDYNGGCVLGASVNLGINVAIASRNDGRIHLVSEAMKEKIEALAKQKSEKIKEVKPEIASLYEQIVRSKRGLALVQVEGEDCPACQIQLRPQVINEVKLKENIVVCENCSRILCE